MRPGPQYSQHILQDEHGYPVIQVPLELVDQIEVNDYVIWIDRGDGDFLLRPMMYGNENQS